MGVFRTQKGDREVVVMVVEQGGGMLFGFINVEQCMDERFGSTRVVMGCFLAKMTQADVTASNRVLQNF